MGTDSPVEWYLVSGSPFEWADPAMGRGAARSAPCPSRILSLLSEEERRMVGLVCLGEIPTVELATEQGLIKFEHCSGDENRGMNVYTTEKRPLFDRLDETQSAVAQLRKMIGDSESAVVISRDEEELDVTETKGAMAALRNRIRKASKSPSYENHNVGTEKIDLDLAPNRLPALPENSMGEQPYVTGQIRDPATLSSRNESQASATAAKSGNLSAQISESVSSSRSIPGGQNQTVGGPHRRDRRGLGHFMLAVSVVLSFVLAFVLLLHLSRTQNSLEQLRIELDGLEILIKELRYSASPNSTPVEVTGQIHIETPISDKPQGGELKFQLQDLENSVSIQVDVKKSETDKVKKKLGNLDFEVVNLPLETPLEVAVSRSDSPEEKKTFEFSAQSLQKNWSSTSPAPSPQEAGAKTFTKSPSE